ESEPIVNALVMRRHAAHQCLRLCRKCVARNITNEPGCRHVVDVDRCVFIGAHTYKNFLKSRQPWSLEDQLVACCVVNEAHHRPAMGLGKFLDHLEHVLMGQLATAVGDKADLVGHLDISSEFQKL